MKTNAKTLVMYYSFTGHTKEMAEKQAKKNNADSVEIKESKKRSKWNAYLKGCVQARKQSSTKIDEVNIDFTKYERILIGAPIWAGYPAPAFNSMIDMIPSGKEVELFFLSGSGSTAKTRNKIKKYLSDHHIKVSKYMDLKS
ncbi:flavodoxin family protein [Lachnoclostridium phytofermentans]|uniref:flavodoxin family protein n=1 Tax=Lachnoclostridium phytofermentans TaxID=66219 RepID=UPI00068E9735|nr:flavodoxin [Lachnoclostridium phytofermentans]